MSVGKEAIRAASAEAGIGSPGFSVSWAPTKIEVAKSGELAYAIGTNRGTVPNAYRGERQVHRNLEEGFGWNVEDCGGHVQLRLTSTVDVLRLMRQPPNNAIERTEPRLRSTYETSDRVRFGNALTMPPLNAIV